MFNNLLLCIIIIYLLIIFLLDDNLSHQYITMHTIKPRAGWNLHDQLLLHACLLLSELTLCLCAIYSGDIAHGIFLIISEVIL